MKLLFCVSCKDVFRLTQRERACACGRCGGHYINGLDAVFWGDSAMPLGFENGSFSVALENQPKAGLGKRFTAFVIPENCPTMTKIDPVNKIAGQEDDHDETQRLRRDHSKAQREGS